MPIPTRSASLREPRNPSSSIARPVTNTKTSTTGTTKPATKSSLDKPRPPSNPSPVETTPVEDNGVFNRARTLLPQRNNNSSREDDQARGEAKHRPGESETRLRREPSQPSWGNEKKDSTTAPTNATLASRRQSLMRPGALRIASTAKTNVSAAKKGDAVPPSPPKQVPLRSPAPSSTQRPPSPKKTKMPPPQRPVRSASLRQPPGTGPPAAVRGHTRHRSQMVPPTARPVPPDPTPATQKSRPQFSTYQQHYSPKKPTKPPTPTPGAATPSDRLLIPTSWPDIAALQTELLQLSLFHSRSLHKQADWRSESEARLHQKFDDVTSQYYSLIEDEKRRQSQLNAQALDCWLQRCGDHQGAYSFSEQIQILSQVLQEVSDLGTCDMNGRYTQVVEAFENWFEGAQFVRHHRESKGMLDGDVFLDPLDQSWKEEVQTLNLKLEYCARQLQNLDIQGSEEVEQSALARIARGLTESTMLMMQEIREMKALESELVLSEREAISRLAERLMGPQERIAPRLGIWNQ